MVQIIQRPPSSSDRFAQAFANLSSSLSQKIPEEMLGSRERKALGAMSGEDMSDIRNPDVQRQLLAHSLGEKSKAAEFKRNMEEGLMDYETVKKFAGEDVADFYKAATVGGKTKIINSIVDALERNENFGDMLGGASGEGEPEFNFGPTPGDDVEPERKDFTKRPRGYNRSEWAKHRETWGKKNTESLDTAREQLSGNRRDMLGTKKLQQLSDKLPEGLERWIINPNTGEIYGLAQLAEKAPTAAQEWVKEVSRFGNRAKQAYGSRVTNFDLVQYMKQFPSLLNTAEGRRSILRMMEINYEMDALYNKAAQQIIDDYGSDNIPPAEVDKMARRLIKKRSDELENEYLNIESENEGSFMREGMSRPSLEELFGG